MAIIEKLGRLNVAVPKALAEADELRAAVHAAGVYVVDNSEVNAFCARLRARTLKPGDVAAEMISVGSIAAARQGLKLYTEDIARSLDAGERLALHQSADELYAALRPIVAEQGNLLAAAVSVVGVEPDSKLLGRLGSSAGASWGAFESALGALREVETIVNEIATASGAIRRLPPATWVDLSTITSPADLERLDSTFGKFPQLAHLGYTIALNTQPEVANAMQRIEGVSAATRAAAEARKQAARDANLADFDARVGGVGLRP